MITLSMRRLGGAKFLLIALFIFASFILFGFKSAFGADVLFFNSGDSSSNIRRSLEIACEFYGLKLAILKPKSQKLYINLADHLNERPTIVIHANVLKDIDPNRLLRAVGEKTRQKSQILIVCVTNQTDRLTLAKWAGGYSINCKRNNVTSSSICQIANMPDVVRELTGQKVPIPAGSLLGHYVFRVNNTHTFMAIMSVSTNTGAKLNPFFIKTSLPSADVFFLTKTGFPENFHSSALLPILPYFVYLRYACGERCWHTVQDSGNLTIDDPWLVDPYGHLHYENLLAEMEKHNFHTTIAFIPWNFDRSTPKVVSLFKNHPNRLSLCIHGNNHDHREFYKYETEPDDAWPAKPLGEQEADIQQAIARMEQFQKLTDLAFAKVMVFPHNIAPAKTLGLLKKYNFLATVNARNVPLGSNAQEHALPHFRTVTMQFENFPSVKRFGVQDRAEFEFAIDLFLDNPILLFAHHDLFEKGIDAFSKIAGIINHIQPDIVWLSLGEVVRHLYLERLREDHSYDILAFSSDIVLTNKHPHDVRFRFQKEESFSFPIRRVIIDGHSQPYNEFEDKIAISILIPRNESRHIAIEYGNDLDVQSVDISKKTLRVNLLRKLSDFRDLTLSRNVIAMSFVRIYYSSGLYTAGLKGVTVLLFFGFITVAYVGWRFRKRWENVNHK